MRLGVRFLRDVGGVNNWAYLKGNVPDFYAGTPQVIYLQLVDEETAGYDGFTTDAPRRYAPAAGATVTAVLNSVDDAKRETKTLTQPYSNDSSIWRLDISPADKMVGTVGMTLTVTESGESQVCGLNRALNVRKVV